MGNKLLIIQPILPEYRINIFDKIARCNKGNVTVYAGMQGAAADPARKNAKNCNFVYEDANWRSFFGTFIFNKKLLRLWHQHDVIFHVANLKYWSLWVLLLTTLFTNKTIYLHGQGGYKNSSFFVNSTYKMLLFLCDGYICYTDYSKQELLKKLPRGLQHKVSVCQNTLDIAPVNKVLKNNISHSIFYIGRLRQGCDIDILLTAALRGNVNVKVIGTGDSEYLERLKNKYGSIATFYGAIFDEVKQREIASTCFAGAYGGDAGLSVVHYMGLGLPVIVHNDIARHMGPEASYVIDGVNGLLFERLNVDSLLAKINILLSNDELRYQLAQGALNTFTSLSKPCMAEKFLKIMGLIK